MSFFCPKCKMYRLEIVESIKVEPGPSDDDKSIQAVRCPCGFEGIAVYEESRRGADDAVNHTGYFVPENKTVELEKAIKNKENINVRDFTINRETGYSYDGFEMKLEHNNT